MRNFERGSFAEDLRTFVSGEGEDDGTGDWRGRPAFYARHDLLFPGRQEGYGAARHLTPQEHPHFFTAAGFPNLFQEAAENRCIGLKSLLFEQIEEFFAGQADPHFFQGRESQGNQNFNDETEDGGINPASGSARLRGRGRIAFFPRKHADEKNSCHRSDNRADYRQGHGLFFQFTEVVGLLMRLLHQAVRLIDDVQPGGSYPHQECELFLRAICRHDKSVLSSSTVFSLSIV